MFSINFFDSNTADFQLYLSGFDPLHNAVFSKFVLSLAETNI